MFHRMPLDRWAEDYKSRNDDMPQWYPHLFGGMPSYGGFIYAPADPSRKIFDFLGFGWGLRYWIHFIIAGIGMYTYLRWKGISEIASFFGSLSFSLSPYLFGLINAGHPAKMYAIAFIPLVLLFAEKVMEKQELRSALLLAVLTAFQLWTKHVQIVYYTWMLVVFIWLWQAGSAFRLKQFNLKKSGLSIGLMAGAIVISGFLVVDPYLPIYRSREIPPAEPPQHWMRRETQKRGLVGSMLLSGLFILMKPFRFFIHTSTGYRTFLLAI